MPRSQGTSRKGKPKKHERAAGMGRSLQKVASRRKHVPSASTNGMAMRPGVDSINVDEHNGKDSGSGFVDHRASVLDVNDLDDFLIQAEMANREFVSEKERLVVVDQTAQAATAAISSSSLDIVDEEDEYGRRLLPRGGSNNNNGTAGSGFAFQELSVPRRPAWDATTTPSELDRREKESFLDWRRSIAQKEEEILHNRDSFSSLGVTPFEKNLEIWRQLWRVLERCSCIVQIVDARNPLFYLSRDLKRYASDELGRPMLLLINKSDYLTAPQRRAWHDYLSDPHRDGGDGAWLHVFFSAHDEQQRLDEAASIAMAAAEAAAAAEEEAEAMAVAAHQNDDDNEEEERVAIEKDDQQDNNDINGEDQKGESSTILNDKSPSVSQNIGIDKPLSREELLDWLHSFAMTNNCDEDPKYERIPFGMVGFPNVGKSSVINVLMGNAKHAHGVVRVAVASQPGKTKHFQTLLLPDRTDMLLCDCPGLVFPSFVNNSADLIAAGVYPIAQMRDPWPVMNLLCRRIPREVLNAQYSLQIPLPTADGMLQARNGEIPRPTAEEFLTTYCAARSIIAAGSGIPDYQRAARIIIKEYADGKLLYCHAPPGEDVQAFQRETLLNALQKTRKLRDKLSLPQTQADRNEAVDSDVDDDGDDDSDTIEEPNIDEDDMLLELMGEMSTTTSAASFSSGKKTNNPPPTRTKKWGKKGRKIRNKDPYGCHSTPDDMLGDDDMAAPKGLSVKGGKKKSHKGYTRGGIRAVI